MFACSGILFNHESPRRGFEFVTRKISHHVALIKLGFKKELRLGNLSAKRDWGHAKDYVEAMWKMMQQKKPKDYVIATGKQYTVKQFVNLVLKDLNIKHNWKGKGFNEVGINKKTKKTLIKIDKKFFRATEVDDLIGDYSKAKKLLRWKPTINIEMLVNEMISHELTIEENSIYS